MYHISQIHSLESFSLWLLQYDHFNYICYFSNFIIKSKIKRIFKTLKSAIRARGIIILPLSHHHQESTYFYGKSKTKRKSSQYNENIISFQRLILNLSV